MNEYLFPNNQVGKGKGANNDVITVFYDLITEGFNGVYLVFLN